jgi:CheY-like chemotaxis protein
VIILIIDDEPVCLEVMKQLVSKLPNCQTQACTSASAAFSWCIGHEPDLVIVDYMMPNIDGIEFTRRLRGLPNRTKTPVVMVSAVSDQQLVKRALQVGIDDFLTKPFDFVELQTCVSNMLGLRAMQGQLAKKALVLQARTMSHDEPQRDTTLTVLDRNISRARLGGDEKLLGEVARIFIHTVPGVLASIRAATLEKDFDQVLGYVIALKGAVAAVEAPDVLQFLSRLEEHAKMRDDVGTVAAFAMVQALAERLLRELAPIVPRSVEPEFEEDDAQLEKNR